MEGMRKGRFLCDDELEDVLAKSRKIAIIGLSRNDYKASHAIAKQLVERYDVVGVNPAGKVEGFRTYGSIEELARRIREVDIVVVFRPSDEVGEIAEKLLKSGLKFQVLWMQEGIKNERAARLLIEHGINVVMNRCVGKTFYELERKIFKRDVHNSIS